MSHPSSRTRHSTLPHVSPLALAAHTLIRHLGTGLAFLGFACAALQPDLELDSDVHLVLDARQAAVREARADDVQVPDARPLNPAGTPGDPVGGPSDTRERSTLGLEESLQQATGSNRDFVSQRERLYLQALSLLGTRHVFSTRLSAALEYALRDTEGLGPDRDVFGTASARRILPFGGNLALTLNTGFLSFDDGLGADGAEYDSNVNVTWSQPLLRGFGSEVALNPLTQAERDLLYAVRDFELFRLDFAVDVAGRFYDLVGRQRAIGNTRRNLDSFVFGRQQAEALFSVGRKSQLDVLRAKRQELTAEDSLIAAEESYALALDRFKIFLGLPVDEDIAIAPEEPAFIPVDFDLDSAVSAAVQNRLDYATRLDRLEDAERTVRLAANSLLPDLDFTLGATVAAPGQVEFDEQELDELSTNASLRLELPLDRRLERNSHRAAQIALGRAQRDFDQFRDNLELEIRSSFRELERRRSSLDIQRRLIQDQQRNVNIAQLRFERGDLPNRDVVEANQSLLAAENQLISEQVNYEIARLQLLRDLGILFVDDNGLFQE